MIELTFPDGLAIGFFAGVFICFVVVIFATRITNKRITEFIKEDFFKND